MLRMGSSRPWQDAMEVLTGERKMDASGLLEYFQPLHDWLKAENKRNNVTVGWMKKSDGKTQPFFKYLFYHCFRHFETNLSEKLFVYLI